MLFEEIYWLGTEHPADFELRSELVSVGLKVHTISFDTLLPHKDRIKRLVVDYSLLTEKTKLDELVKFQKKYQYRMVVLLPSGTINYEILNHLRIDSYLFESTNKLENLAQIKLWLKNLAKESDAFDEFNRSIYENFPFAIYEADDAGNYLYANKAGCELLGYTKKELLRLSIKDVSSEKKLNLELYESFKKVGKMSDYVYLKTKQGKIVLIQFYAFKIGPNRYLSINNLIEDSISAKELLIRHKEELSKIFDLLPLYIYTVDRNSTIKFVNKKFQAEFGLPLKDIIGKTAYDFYPVEHASKYLRDDQRVIRTQKVFQAVEENVHPQTGITHHVHVTKLPIYNEKAEVTGVLGVFYDMTSEYMLQMTKDAQLKEKDLLLREAHHRIKNNLNMIIGMMSLDASAITNESAKIALNAAIVKMKSMMGIYNQLYVEIDQKKLVQMQSFLTDLFEDFKEHLVPPEITLHLQVKKLLLDDRFASMVGIILTELITNSIKYAFPLGFGKIEASVLKRNNCLVIKVADDGRGLPEDVRINHMYGFGLSMIQQLIETVNGKIVFDSKHKSTIEIHLPNTSLEKPELISE